MWRPFAGNHAIERVRVAITLKQGLAQKAIKALQSSMDADRAELGFESLVDINGSAFTFQFGPAGIIPVAGNDSTILTGWEAKRILGEGHVVEALVLNTSQSSPQSSSTLTYETTEYSRWGNFKARFDRVMGAILPKYIEFGDNASTFLEFYDRFVFDGSGVGGPEEVLPSLVSSLPPDAMEDGELWHLHRGWFEKGTLGRLLINQNFDCQDVDVNGVSRRSIQVLTRAEGRVGFWSLESETIEQHLEIMHDRTKQVFKDVLSLKMQKIVGILE